VPAGGANTQHTATHRSDDSPDTTLGKLPLIWLLSTSRYLSSAHTHAHRDAHDRPSTRHGRTNRTEQHSTTKPSPAKLARALRYRDCPPQTKQNTLTAIAASAKCETAPQVPAHMRHASASCCNRYAAARHTPNVPEAGHVAPVHGKRSPKVLASEYDFPAAHSAAERQRRKPDRTGNKGTAIPPRMPHMYEMEVVPLRHTAQSDSSRSGQSAKACSERGRTHWVITRLDATADARHVRDGGGAAAAHPGPHRSRRITGVHAGVGVIVPPLRDARPPRPASDQVQVHQPLALPGAHHRVGARMYDEEQGHDCQQSVESKRGLRGRPRRPSGAGTRGMVLAAATCTRHCPTTRCGLPLGSGSGLPPSPLVAGARRQRRRTQVGPRERTDTGWGAPDIKSTQRTRARSELKAAARRTCG
jgi:hypothetical protein